MPSVASSNPSTPNAPRKSELTLYCSRFSCTTAVIGRTGYDRLGFTA